MEPNPTSLPLGVDRGENLTYPDTILNGGFYDRYETTREKKNNTKRQPSLCKRRWYKHTLILSLSSPSGYISEVFQILVLNKRRWKYVFRIYTRVRFLTFGQRLNLYIYIYIYFFLLFFFARI